MLKKKALGQPGVDALGHGAQLGDGAGLVLLLRTGGDELAAKTMGCVGHNCAGHNYVGP